MFGELLEQGKFILFLDGFDEVAKNRARTLAVELTTFVTQRNHLRTIVTSRPENYGFVGWGDFRELRIQPLSRSRCLELIGRLNYDPALKEAFCTAVRIELYDSHGSFLENPLLTTLMLMTFQEFGHIERRMHLFYGQAYETLYHRHDATKIGYQRDTAANLDSDEFRAAFAAFAVQSYLDNTVSFPKRRHLSTPIGPVDLSHSVPDLIPMHF